MYKFLLLLFVFVLLSCSSNGNDFPPEVVNQTIPTINIIDISGIAKTTASSGGKVTNDGGINISKRGICWSTTSNPDINDNKTINGSGFGEFISQLSELVEDTTYYVRAYATNSKGTAYSSELNFTTSPSCNGGVYNGNLTFSTQQEVEDFGTKCYVGVAGILQIGNYEVKTDEITDLSSLSTLEEINGALNIFSNKMLTSLNGLEGITQVYSLAIAQNLSLISISGLSNLEIISGSGAPNNGNDGPGIHIWENDAITTLDGLEKITIIGSLEISKNPSLISIQGLKNINSSFDGIDLYDNNLLTTLDGFNSLTNIGTYCRIGFNSKLSSIEALKNVKSIGGSLFISNNNSLTSLQGLNNINSVNQIFIESNLMLNSLVGLPNLSTIADGLSINGNNTIVDLHGIEGSSLSGRLGIQGNSNLTTLSQLNNLTKIGGNTSIINNNKITSLVGLENLIFIDGWLEIAGNEQLTDFCPLTNLFINGTITDYSIIDSNAYNPSNNDLMSGICSQ